MKVDKEFSKELIRYGEYLADDEIENNKGFTRIRVIKYDGKMYYHKMVNGNVKCIILL